MNRTNELRALVVEPEAELRMNLQRALAAEDFRCDVERDGQTALERAEAEQYDLLVTELILPNLHGHALARTIANRQPRATTIVICDPTAHPHITRDMLLRGVDDVVFKPTDPASLAAKLRALVLQRRDQTQVEDPSPAEHKGYPPIVSSDELQQKLSGSPSLRPLSQAALEVYTLTGDDGIEAEEIAEKIATDAGLAVEFLRIGNSSAFNPSGRGIGNLTEVVVRIGRKRTGEMAISSNALGCYSACVVPWLETSVCRCRSIVAATAVVKIMEQAGLQELEYGLYLGATLHGMGRIALGLLFPDHYEQMLEHCLADASSLDDQEALVFPRPHPSVSAILMRHWNVPSTIDTAVEHAALPFSEIEQLPDGPRQRAEALRTAILLARIVVGNWAWFEVVEIPPPAVMQRLNLVPVSEFLGYLRNSLGPLDGEWTRGPQGEKHVFAVASLDAPDGDAFAELLRAMNLTIAETGASEIVSGVGASAQRIVDWLQKEKPRERRLVVCHQDHAGAVRGTGVQTLGIPCSFAALTNALQNL